MSETSPNPNPNTFALDSTQGNAEERNAEERNADERNAEERNAEERNAEEQKGEEQKGEEQKGEEQKGEEQNAKKRNSVSVKLDLENHLAPDQTKQEILSSLDKVLAQYSLADERLVCAIYMLILAVFEHTSYLICFPRNAKLGSLHGLLTLCIEAENRSFPDGATRTLVRFDVHSPPKEIEVLMKDLVEFGIIPNPQVCQDCGSPSVDYESRLYYSKGVEYQVIGVSGKDSRNANLNLKTHYYRNGGSVFRGTPKRGLRVGEGKPVVEPKSPKVRTALSDIPAEYHKVPGFVVDDYRGPIKEKNVECPIGKLKMKRYTCTGGCSFTKECVPFDAAWLPYIR